MDFRRKICVTIQKKLLFTNHVDAKKYHLYRMRCCVDRTIVQNREKLHFRV